MTAHTLAQEQIHTGPLILVNQKFPVRTAPVFLESVSGSVQLERIAAQALNRLMDTLNGWEAITPVSGWRSAEEQTQLYRDSLREHGEAFTRKFVALPHHSEHETGLAVDLGLAGPDIDFIRPAFPYTGICGAFRQQAADYGFILRYPAGKEHITNIAHEPWHFRYVGSPHAQIMDALGLTLEEYHDFVKDYPLNGTPYRWQTDTQEYEIFYQAASAAGNTQLSLSPDCTWSISGDNEAGFVVVRTVPYPPQEAKTL